MTRLQTIARLLLPLALVMVISVDQFARQAGPAPTGKVATAAAKKLSTPLRAIVEQYRTGGNRPVRDKRGEVDIDDKGNALVDLRAEVTEELLGILQAAGGTVIRKFPAYESIRARIPIDKLEAIAERSEVKFIRPAEQAFTRQRPAEKKR
jgi:hypothetical protein